MSVSAFNQTNFTTQDPATYKTAIDGNFSAFKRIAGDFAAHAQPSPNMTVAIDAGHIFNGSTLTEVSAQSTGTITAPVSNPRIDRVVIDALTGAVSVITGTEASSPVAPTITVGALPVAQVLLQTTTTAITNSMLTDERDLTRKGATSGAQATIVTATTTGIVAGKSTNLILSGSTTITSFGSAGTTGTIYRCRLTGSPLITYNATSLITPGSANIQGAAGDAFDLEDIGSGNWRIREYFPASGKPVVQVVPKGSKFGLQLTYASTTSITVGLGQAADSTGALLMSITGSAVTLNIGSSGAGGLDTGSVAASTWYHVYLINGTSGASVLMSTSASSPTLPSGYTYFRRIGSIKTDSSSHVLSFFHTVEMDIFYWTTRVQDINHTLSSSPTLVTLASIPTGIKVRPLVYYLTTNATYLIMYSGDETAVNPVATATTSPGLDTVSSGGADYDFVTSNTSGQIGIGLSAGSGTVAVVYTRGWIDSCGRFG